MSKTKYECQSTQENKPSPAKQENAPQQDEKEKTESKQPQQVTNDIKWVPFLIGFHLVTQALNRLSLRRPSPPRQEEHEDGNKRRHCLSDKAKHRLGNGALIAYQALVFFAFNFSAAITNEGVKVSETVLPWGMVVFFSLEAVSVVCYFIAADKNSPKIPYSNKPALWLFLLALMAAIPTVPLFFGNSVEYVWLQLFVGTVCQLLAGFIGWKAADLIPAPSSNGSK